MFEKIKNIKSSMVYRIIIAFLLLIIAVGIWYFILEKKATSKLDINTEIESDQDSPISESDVLIWKVNVVIDDGIDENLGDNKSEEWKSENETEFDFERFKNIWLVLSDNERAFIYDLNQERELNEMGFENYYEDCLSWICYMLHDDEWELYKNYFTMRELMKRWKIYNQEYTNKEISDIIASYVKYYICYNSDWTEFFWKDSYIELKNKIKEDIPHYSNKVDEYFSLSWAKDYFNVTVWKSINCYWYKSVTLMDDVSGSELINWIADVKNPHPSKYIKGEIDDNEQTFKIKFVDADNLEFYTNLTPWDAVTYGITRNDSKLIVATNITRNWAYIDNLVISKITWFGLWTKINWMGTPFRWEIPYWIMTYFYCDNNF